MSRSIKLSNNIILSHVEAINFDICSGTSESNESEVVLTSPRYPFENYEPWKNCETVVQFHENTPFRIEFLGEFEISQGCDDNFVEIRNGKGADAPLILKVCGNTKPDATIAFGSSVKIKFKSGWYGALGFSLKISKLAESEGEYKRWIHN